MSKLVPHLEAKSELMVALSVYMRILARSGFMAIIDCIMEPTEEGLPSALGGLMMPNMPLVQ